MCFEDLPGLPRSIGLPSTRRNNKSVSTPEKGLGIYNRPRSHTCPFKRLSVLFPVSHFSTDPRWLESAYVVPTVIYYAGLKNDEQMISYGSEMSAGLTGESDRA